MVKQIALIDTYFDSNYLVLLPCKDEAGERVVTSMSLQHQNFFESCSTLD